MALNCIGISGATGRTSYAVVLIALLTLACGITFLQIAGNVVIAVVEPEDRGVSRLTFLQGFNLIGTVVAPLIGASFLLTARSGQQGGAAWVMLAMPFGACALVLVVLAAGFTGARDLLNGISPPRRRSLAGQGRVLTDRRLMAGTFAMFSYVGAEVTIGPLLTNCLVQPEILDVSPVTAEGSSACMGQER